ncbi:hypothetical protein TrLO_g15040 [Triparma laevis f. longispina]|uniref:NAD(+) diphosphatase n=1 Tax=Triparma laevis f. longispina TaxID=1714387 RepID=A0A9W6ZZC0_9STRA|nr:hypothetical protein TrLO_g15040 [Triparma laevis f. longispina]
MSASGSTARAFRSVVEALKLRGKTVTSVESTTGGLISSNIMKIDGASSVYYGGSVAYNTKKCKPILLNDAKLHASLVNAPTNTAQPGDSDGDMYKRSKLDWTSKNAVAFCEAMGTDFCVAEGGAAGPSFRPKDLTAGFSAISIAARNPSTNKAEIVHSGLIESSHSDREKNMELFATSAARELLGAVTNDDGLDRRVDLRTDPQQLSEIFANPAARFVVVNNSKILFSSETSLGLLTKSEAEQFVDSEITSSNCTFLGFTKKSPLFTLEAAQLFDDVRFMDTRTQSPLLDFTENQIALTTIALMNWQRSTKFCSKCGSATSFTQGGHCSICTDSDCATMTFPRNDPAVIVAVTSRCNSKILLARSPRHPEKMFTTLAGFVEAGETFEDAVKREVFEESGMKVDDDVQYLKSQPWPFPQSSMIAFRAICDSTVELNLDEEELVEARWFGREEVRKACKVQGPVMRTEVAAKALENDPSLTLLVPPKRVVARELIEKWLSESDNN